MRRSQAVGVGVLALLAAAGWLVLDRLSVSYDLAYFLPEPVTQAQQVLVDRAGQGPGSRLVYVTLPGADESLRNRIGAALAAVDAVRRVWPPQDAPGLDAIPEPVLASRYLLADVDTSVAGLRRALEARLEDLSLVDDPAFLALVARDPHLAGMQVLERLETAATGRSYRLPGGTPFLLLETRPPAFDLTAQRALVADIRAVIADLAPQMAPGLYGAGVYGVALARSVQREATLFSSLAAGGLAVLLWGAYRSVRAALLAAVPLAAGGVAGLAALALLFPQVHGITLAFGFTLMGVTVDYGLHVLSHLRQGRRHGLVAVWPTLLLSAVSTALAFLAFTASGSPGLMQLGVFSVAGILTAAACAWLVLPRLAAPFAAPSPESDSPAPAALTLRYWPLALAGLAAVGLIATRPALWNDDLSSLTPVPRETLEADRLLRQQTGAPDIRYLVVTRAAELEPALERVLAVDRLLEQARAAGELADYRTVSALVPAVSIQHRRREALQPAGLQGRLAAAAEGLPFRPGALAPFVADVQRTAGDDQPVTPESYAGTPLAELVESMLYRSADGWVALGFLSGLEDPGGLAERLAAVPETGLADLTEASRSLLASYRARLLEILGVALAAVTLVLAAGLRSWRRLLWVLGTVTAATGLTVALVTTLFGGLSLFQLVAATLVGGLGLDYALFFSRPPASRTENRHTVHAVTVCFASTALVFGLLGASGIPVLHGIGVTVGVGVLIAYGIALGGRTVTATA